MRRDYPDRPFLGVGAVIIDDNKVLLVRRANPPLQGEWSIPGGLVETGESTRDAIIREVLEETALRVEVAALVEVFERILRDNRIACNITMCFWITGVATSADRLKPALT